MSKKTRKYKLLGAHTTVINKKQVTLERGAIIELTEKEAQAKIYVNKLERVDFTASTDKNSDLINTLKAELEEAKAENEGLKAELEEAKAENEGLKAELEEAKAENEGLKAELEEAKPEVKAKAKPEVKAKAKG